MLVGVGGQGQVGLLADLPDFIQVIRPVDLVQVEEPYKAPDTPIRKVWDVGLAGVEIPDGDLPDDVVLAPLQGVDKAHRPGSLDGPSGLPEVDHIPLLQVSVLCEPFVLTLSQ